MRSIFLSKIIQNLDTGLIWWKKKDILELTKHVFVAPQSVKKSLGKDCVQAGRQRVNPTIGLDRLAWIV